MVMKRDIPTEAGIGFTILIAAATLAVAVVAGIFLIYQSDINLTLNTPSRAPVQAQMSLSGPTARANSPAPAALP
jgi:uncharacterized membrane protein YdcZ (DUF606 family)